MARTWIVVCDASRARFFTRMDADQLTERIAIA
jgi:hypothetical protein